MAKFNAGTVQPATFSPVASEQTPSGLTHEGGAGYARDTKSELFLLAVSNMVGEDTFYETAGKRDDRYTQLVHAATIADPEWTARFLKWLRSEANMRSASLVGAAEFAKARLDAGENGMSRQVVDSVLQRADEPGEFLAYWTSTHGRKIPKPVKRGVADAVQRLYNERNLLKYDSDARGFRFGDVLDLTHPSPSAEWQGDLFQHAIDRRHGRDNEIPASLETLHVRAELMAWPVEKRRDLFKRPELDSAQSVLRQAGMTWESLAGWLQGPMDARAWEAVIPSMGYMALLRNLRNFEQAGVSDEVAKTVADKLANPDEVAKSRQFPMRFLSAFKANEHSLRWGWPLEQALTHSLRNVPILAGRTLVLVDLSASMWDRMSGRSELERWEAAAIFGVALAKRAEHADLVRFGNASEVVKLQSNESVLRAVRTHFRNSMGGTATAAAVQRHLRPGYHDRVVILTDEQTGGYSWGGNDPSKVVPGNVPLYTWNLAGYERGHGPSGSRNRHTFGGLTDAAFRMIPFLEAGLNAAWPF